MLLNAKGITRRFGYRSVLDNVDISICAGQVVSVFGANGVGKTTLIKILSTLLPPTSGEIWINGLEVKKHRDTVRKLVGVVVHEPLAYLDLSPYENLKFLGRLYDIRYVEERIHHLLSDVGLNQFAREPMKNFSRGMIQRFMIAKALLHDPPILFLDEPFSGLDTSAVNLMINRIELERQRNKGILLTTHNLEFGYHVGSHFHFLVNGDIENVGQKQQIGLEELTANYEKRLNSQL
tara:strand:+ start:440 stop:1147 length:708 start_codon:yes stop_codon:yes gene_type:complete